MSYRNIEMYTEKRVILIDSLGRKTLIQYRELNEKINFLGINAQLEEMKFCVGLLIP